MKMYEIDIIIIIIIIFYVNLDIIVETIKGL